jgi:hypothetical protein
MMRLLFLTYAQFGSMHLVAFTPYTLCDLPSDATTEVPCPERAQAVPEVSRSLPNHSLTRLQRLTAWLTSYVSDRHERSTR